MNLCAYILAGGAGERFWPLSTPDRPKQLLKLFSEKSMIRETVDRILPLVPAERIFIGTNARQAQGILEELPMLPRENVLVEPAFKDTAAAVGFGALYVQHRHPGACMIVLASDHLVKDAEGFLNSVRHAVDEAVSSKTIVTLGIRPSYPETGYGYIEVDKGAKLGDVCGVERFWEKPNLERAEEYVAAGNFLWNSGMFIFEATTILEEIERYMPRHAAILDEIAGVLAGGVTGEALTEGIAPLFERFQKISIDFGVMERSIRIRVIPSEFGWNDIGSFRALADVFPADANGNVVRHAKLRQIDCHDNIVVAEGCAVGMIGVRDLVVVYDQGRLLVSHKDRVQDVKKISG